MAVPFLAEKYTVHAARDATLYSDFSTNLDVNPATGDVAIQTDSACVKTSLRNLVLTNKYERLFQPLVGGNVQTLLFDNFTTQTRNDLYNAVIQTGQNYEPRAQSLAVSIQSNPDLAQIALSLIFKTLATGQAVTARIIRRRR